MAEEEEPSPKTITDLPSNLLLHILSFLPTPNAVTASAVSSEFRRLLRRTTTVNFNTIAFRHPSAELSDFINHHLLLRRRDVPILKFTLCYYYPPNHRHRSLVDSWIRYSLAAGARDLELDFDVHLIKEENQTGNYHDYCFHFADLWSSEVRVLSLCRCRLVSSLRRFEVELTELTLFKVTARDEVVSDVLSRCVNLETLRITFLEGVEKLVIRTPKLRVLSLALVAFDREAVRDESAIEVYAPRLVSVNFLDVYVSNYLFEDTSALDDVRVSGLGTDVISWCQMLKYVTGTRRLMMDNMPVWTRELRPLLYGNVEDDALFLNLHYLELRTGYTKVDLCSMPSIFRGAPLLVELVLDYCYHQNEEEICVEEIKSPDFSFDIPCLKQVKMKNFRRSNSELFMLAMFQLYKVVLQKYILVFAGMEGKTWEMDAHFNEMD